MVQVKYYSYGTGQSYITMPIKTAREIGIEHLDELELEIQEIEGKKRVILTPIKREPESKGDAGKHL